MNYESWRISFQSSESASRQAFKLWQEALAHPAQEPISVKFPTMLRKMWSGTEVQEWLDKNTHPAPSWQGLTDDEMMKIIEACEDKCGRHLIGGFMIARAIEQALRNKNG